MFPSASQHQRIKSVLTDLSKTASDLRHITSKALDHVANGLMPQLRYLLMSAFRVDTHALWSSVQRNILECISPASVAHL